MCRADAQKWTANITVNVENGGTVLKHVYTIRGTSGEYSLSSSDNGKHYSHKHDIKSFIGSIQKATLIITKGKTHVTYIPLNTCIYRYSIKHNWPVSPTVNQHQTSIGSTCLLSFLYCGPYRWEWYHHKAQNVTLRRWPNIQTTLGQFRYIN